MQTIKNIFKRTVINEAKNRIYKSLERNFLTPMWSLEVVCYALRQDTLSTLSQSIQLKLGAGLGWGLTCGVLVSHPEGVNDSHPLSTTETRDKHRPYAPSWHRKGFNLALNYKSIWASTLILRHFNWY